MTPADRSHGLWCILLTALMLILASCSALPRDERRERAQGSSGGSTRRDASRSWYGPEVSEVRAVETHSQFGMVAAATQDACRVGAQVLERGGNAVDAAVATALALAVTDPGDSGLGGMTLALVRLADGRAVAIDGACMVPSGVDGVRIAELQEERIRVAPEYVAVPGSLAALDHMARRYGTMPLGELIAPAIELAETGFTLNQFQRASVEKYADDVRGSPELRAMILDNGSDLPPPDRRFFRPGFARTLHLIEERGSQELAFGSIAHSVAADLALRGSSVTSSDLAVVRPHERRPLRTTYRDTEVLSFPSPGSGGEVLYLLNMLERYPPELLRNHSAERLQLLIEVFRTASADRYQVRQDPNDPQALHDYSFLEKEFAAQRTRHIQLGRATPEDALPERPQCRERERETTHLAVIDRWGNAVSMTQTLGNFFGSDIMHPQLEIVYNNLLEGMCEPKPRQQVISDMSPTIVVRDGRPLLALGTAGSSRIPAIIALVISNVVDGGMGLGAAIEAPRVLWGGSRGRPPSVEVRDPITKRDVRSLKRMGYKEISVVRLPTVQGRLINLGGVNAVLLDPTTGTMTGVGDPRRNGCAQGSDR